MSNLESRALARTRAQERSRFVRRVTITFDEVDLVTRATLTQTRSFAASEPEQWDGIMDHVGELESRVCLWE